MRAAAQSARGPARSPSVSRMRAVNGRPGVAVPGDSDSCGRYPRVVSTESPVRCGTDGYARQPGCRTERRLLARWPRPAPVTERDPTSGPACIPAAGAVSAASSNMVLPRPGSPHRTSASPSVAAGSRKARIGSSSRHVPQALVKPGSTRSHPGKEARCLAATHAWSGGLRPMRSATSG